MLRRPAEADDPSEWLKRARSSLILSGNETSGVYFEDLCFEAQQAAEKAIKAVLLLRRIDFPYVRDLTRLLRLLTDAGEKLPPEVQDARSLSQFASAFRYPHPGPPLTRADWLQATQLAQAVVAWAEGLTQRR